MLTALLCATPTSLILTGCGGGNSTLPTGTVAGEYSGTYTVTGGPSNGETGAIALEIQSDGDITGSARDAGGSTASFTGTANTTNGNFTITGLFGETGTSGQASGTILVDAGRVRGSGNFSLNNGNSGTITFAKVTG